MYLDCMVMEQYRLANCKEVAPETLGAVEVCSGTVEAIRWHMLQLIRGTQIRRPGYSHHCLSIAQPES